MEWYQKAWVFVCLSLKEEFGIVNVEALSCETPVIASGVGGITEVIKNDVNGIIVPPNDPKKLAIALKKTVRKQRIARGVWKKWEENG
jgi:glycosyltransferase involved in cell wall biosynthesis